MVYLSPIMEHIPLEQFIEYTTVVLDKIPAFLRTDHKKIAAYAEQLATHCGNVPVELRGQCDILVLSILYAALRNTATEIIYRENSTDKATILFSQIGNTAERPSYVLPIDVYTEEIESVAVHEIEIDLDTLPHEDWHKTLFSFPQKTETVHIDGYQMPLLVLLQTIEWFLPFSKKIEFNATPITV